MQLKCRQCERQTEIELMFHGLCEDCFAARKRVRKNSFSFKSQEEAKIWFLNFIGWRPKIGA